MASDAVNATVEAQCEPHQLALARMTMAEVLYWKGGSKEAVEFWITRALELEDDVVAEGQPQGLCQLVHIWRKAGELTLLIGEVRNEGFILLGRALGLAHNPRVQALDQVPKIEEIMRRFGIPTCP